MRVDLRVPLYPHTLAPAFDITLERSTLILLDFTMSAKFLLTWDDI